MNANPEFTGRPFIAGAIRGFRSWQPTPGGLLRGVSYPVTWRPGVNHARCVANSGQVAVAHLSSSAMDAYRAGVLALYGAGERYGITRPEQRPSWPVSLHRRVPKIRPHGPEHEVAQLGCRCGFYAYFDRSAGNPFHQRGCVMGLIEGWGTVTVGSHGFRASRARIVALAGVVPPLVRVNYPGVPVFATVGCAVREFPLSVPPEPAAELDGAA